MTKKLFVILAILFLVTACGNGSSRSEPYEVVSEVIERGPDIQNVTFAQSQILPPYGMHVTAEQAVLKLQISTSQTDVLDRSEDIQLALDTIASLAAENEAITLTESSVELVSGSYPRGEISTENVQNLDAATIVLKLTIELAKYDHDFVESVGAFNTFLTAIKLPDTLSVQALSVETKIADMDAYRQQIIERVYEEFDAVQGEYGSEVKFEITGLYDPLKRIQLSDVEYYLYLEPVVVVSEF
jgi:hypothetical protein